MRQRALAGYSIDPRKNLQVFSDEMNIMFAIDANHTPSKSSSEAKALQLLALYRLWGWIDRLEFDDDQVDFASCGVYAILGGSKNNKNATKVP
jgi:hypothetical protein